jgi:hypothetical protein
VEVNRADVVAEVTGAFQAYEKALLDGDNEVLVGWFWEDPALVRFGLADEQRGFAQLRDWRMAQGPLPGRRLYDTVVTTFGTDAAVVTTGFDYPVAGAPPGRQSQTWMRTPSGWRIVSAHVSHPA